MSLHQATHQTDHPEVDALVAYFNALWQNPNMHYEATADGHVIEWGPRDSRVIPERTIESWLTNRAFLTWRDDHR